MSEQFGEILVNGRLRYGTAQKAFNLYLKYLWRLGMIGAPPPHCPIDRIVLEAVGVEGSWTASDCEDEYRRWINAIRKKADEKGVSLAEWEYEVWSEWKLSEKQEASSTKQLRR